MTSSIRRECQDHAIIRSERGLHRHLLRIEATQSTTERREVSFVVGVR